MKFIFPQLIFNIEKWKWNEEYQVYVSTLGHFKDKNKKNLPVLVKNSGYLNVRTPVGIKSCHRLVLLTWRPIPNAEELTVDHLNHNKRDNSLNNLEWVTSSENQKHRQKILGKTKTSQRKIGKFNKNHVLIEEYPSIVDAAKSFGKSRVNIDNALQGKQKTAYGFIWEYLD